jgi:hypothetical protein
MYIEIGCKPSKIVLLVEHSKEPSKRAGASIEASHYSYCSSKDWILDPFNPLNRSSPLRGVSCESFFSRSSEQEDSANPFSDLRPPEVSQI